MLKLFEIEDENPPAVPDQSPADVDQVILPSGISVYFPVSFGLENISDSPPRRSLVHEDFESNEFIVTSEEICF